MGTSNGSFPFSFGKGQDCALCVLLNASKKLHIFCAFYLSAHWQMVKQSFALLRMNLNLYPFECIFAVNHIR